MRFFPRTVAAATTVFALSALLLLAPAASGAQFYVSSTASAQGDGSIGNPWLLKTALAHPGIVKPGDTIFLRGGLYMGRFRSLLTGAGGNPIMVRSYPSEWARIDGDERVSFVTAATASDISFQVSHTSSLRPSSVLRINSEDVYVKGVSGNTLAVVRGWNGTTPAAYNAGLSFGLRDNIFTISGAYTTFRDFEVMSSDPVRTTQISGSAPADIPRGTGISVVAPSVQLINLIVHDAADGIGLSLAATDAEVYGCLIYHNGWQGPDRGHGHGVYAQNATGLKTISDVISFNNFATGMKAFGVNAPVKGVDFRGVVSFNNGSIQAQGYPRETNLYVGTDKVAADLISVTDSFLFHTPGAGGENMHFGFAYPDNYQLTVKNNRVYGGSTPIDVSYWRNTTVTGNSFYLPGLSSWSSQLLLIFRTASSTPIVNWDQNKYFNTALPYSQGIQYSIGYNSAKNSLGGGILSFPEWKAACKCDAGSQYTAGVPTGVEVYIRPNAYEPGRANIVVFNWSGASSAAVSLAGHLNIGESYEIMDAQNYFAGPLASGVFNGGQVTLPMTLSSVSTASGNVPSPPLHTAPMMGTFILRKKTAAGGSVSVTPSSASLSQLQSQQFTAQVAGAANSSVTWSMSPAIGTLYPSGLYAAPNTVTSASSVTVKATSVANPNQSATAVVTLTPPSATVGVSVTPAAVSLTGGTAQQFAAQVTGSTNKSVIWSMSAGPGSLSTAGLYTAPASITAASSITVKATSVADPTKFATAVVNLTSPQSIITVAISPASVSLTAGKTQLYQATVNGTNNKGLTWSISPAIGTISASGTYTAPSSLAASASVTVTATSVADPTRKATALINLNLAPGVIKVSPASISVKTLKTFQFTSTTLGLANPAVVWSVGSPGGGTITPGGLYTAPVMGVKKSYFIRATSAIDSTISGTAVVTIIP